jgi:hypothetical protein
MKCRKIESLLVERLDRRLDAGLESLVQEHLNGCARCRDRLSEFRTTVALLAEDPVPPMPLSEERFLQEVKRRIRQRPARAGARFKRILAFPRLAPVLAAAAVLLLAFGVFRQLNRVRRPSVDLQGVLPASAEAYFPDPLAVDASSNVTMTSADLAALDTIEAEVAQNTDVDDLIEDLTPAEQARLIRTLELEPVHHN